MAEEKMYELNIIVDKQWFDILGQISKHQEGFIWKEVNTAIYEDVL